MNYTRRIGIIGFVVGLILFRNVSSLGKYFALEVICILFCMGIGYSIDKVRDRNFFFPTLYVGSVICICIFYYLFIAGLHPDWCGLTEEFAHTNKFTGKCQLLNVGGCGNDAPWYYEKGGDCYGEEDCFVKMGRLCEKSFECEALFDGETTRDGKFICCPRSVRC